MGILMSDRASPTGKRHRAGRRAAAAVLLFTAALVSPAERAARGDAVDDPSAVVVIGGVAPEGALAAADDVVPGQWRLETLAPRALPGEAPDAQLESLARTYRE